VQDAVCPVACGRVGLPLAIRGVLKNPVLHLKMSTAAADDSPARLMDTLKATDTLVAGWGCAGKILRSEPAASAH
jgi:hypothetical protein